MKIIALSGKIGSGKTTIANMILDKYPTYKKISFAHSLKQTCAYFINKNEDYSNWLTQEDKNKKIVIEGKLPELFCNLQHALLNIAKIDGYVISPHDIDKLDFYYQMKNRRKYFDDKIHTIISILLYGEENVEKMFKQQEIGFDYIYRIETNFGKLTQIIGEKVRYYFGHSVWINALANNLENNTNYIIDDLRYVTEAEYIKTKEDSFIIRINRADNDIRKESKRDLTHKSEIDLDNYNDFDYTLNNDKTLDELLSNVFDILDSNFIIC